MGLQSWCHTDWHEVGGPTSKESSEAARSSQKNKAEPVGSMSSRVTGDPRPGGGSPLPRHICMRSWVSRNEQQK